MRAAPLALALLVACGGADDWSPEAGQRRALAASAETLAVHLETLPGVRDASVVIDAPLADPLGPAAPAPPPRASIVLALADGADAAALERAARDAVAGAVVGLDPAQVTVASAPAPRPPRSRVGPFEVAPGSRAPLVATLALALALIAGLAGWIAWTAIRQRRATGGGG